MEQPELNLREWAAQAKTRRGAAISQRVSGSSPAYPFQAEFDSATYSFSNAIKALQARSLNSRECFSLDASFTLNSKWDEAEKYICNPLSGEVPIECLSAKSLSGRSFANLTDRNKQTKPCSVAQPVHKLPIPEKKVDVNAMTREVGYESTSMIIGSDSPSPASIPPIGERALKRCEFEEDSLDSNSNLTSQIEVIKRKWKRREQEKERKNKEKQ